MPIQPSPEHQAIFDRLIAVAGEAVNAGCAFADAYAPGTADRALQLIAQGFVPRIVIERRPAMTVELLLIGDDEKGERVAVEVFRYQAEPLPAGLH